MNTSDITSERLVQQGLAYPRFQTPAEVVAWMGAVQAQDYAGGKWALGLRLPGIKDAEIEQAFNEGAILRTHIMRPTWHFVTPADIRWMTELTAPRVKALMKYYDRQWEVDAATVVRGNDLIAKALEGGHHLMRDELLKVLEAGGISGEGQRLGHISMHAELDAIMVSGARLGKQMTYALLAERAPDAKRLSREESLAELARRYFTSHGPATIQDYVWWSGLTMNDAKAGLEMVKPELTSEVVDGQTYWLAADRPGQKEGSPLVYLLPNYDEYTVGYTDRSAVYDTQHDGKLDTRGNVLFNYIVIIGGQIAGTWKRTISKKAVKMGFTPFRTLTAEEQKAFEAAVQRFSDFLGLPVVMAD